MGGTAETLAGLATQRTKLDPRRNPKIFWILSVTLALITASIVQSQVAAADRAAAAFGQQRQVMVFTTDLPTGTLVEPEHIESVALPVGLLVDSPSVSDPVGRTVTAAVVSGEVAIEARLSPNGLSGLAAVLPADTRAVAVPTDAGLNLEPADRVDLIAPGDDYTPGRVVVDKALVIAQTEASVTVAVPTDQVPDLVDALVAGRLIPALVGTR